MNSLNYLSRQIDVFATSSTPPPTPLNQSHFVNSGRPPRAKSYSRIVPRRPSHQHQHQHQPQPDSNSKEDNGASGSGSTSVKSFPTHGSKRSFSSPALWSFRKPTLTPTASIPSTPAATVSPIPGASTPSSAPGIVADELSSISPSSRPAALKRNDSYGFGIATHLTESSKPESAPTTSRRPLILRVLTALWDAIYALWLSVSGFLVFPSLAAFGSRSGGDGGGDTTGDEKETDEEEDELDDGIVARAPKRSQLQLEHELELAQQLQLQQLHKGADGIPPSFHAYQMSPTATITITETNATSTSAARSPTGVQEVFSFSLEPPSPEEVQARTETPRIDLIPPTPKSRTPPASPRRKTTPLASGSLLPNPISSSLLTRANTVPTGTTTPSDQQQQQQQQYPSPRAMVGMRMQKTLVLDLDETLIHSTSKPLRAHSGGGLFSMGGFGFGFGEKRGRVAGHMVEVVLGGRCTLYHVYKRPFVDYFLRKVSSWYTLVIFTASMQEYADPVIDWLDAGRGILSRRLFRESCTQLPNGSYTKDLSLIDPDLSRVCLIDNSPVSYNVNPANGIPIEGWISDPSDEALLHLLPVLDSLRFASDVRRILGIRLFN